MLLGNKKCRIYAACGVSQTPINDYKSEEFSQDYYIINFKDIFSVPVDVARAIAEK